MLTRLRRETGEKGGYSIFTIHHSPPADTFAVWLIRLTLKVKDWLSGRASGVFFVVYAGGKPQCDDEQTEGDFSDTFDVGIYSPGVCHPGM